MKKLLFGSVAFVALIAPNAASAADLGLPVKSRALEPEWNWSGFYAGLNAGFARGNTVWHDLDAVFTAGGSIINESNNAFTGGGQIGYNWQFRHAVVGLETDFNYAGLTQTTSLFASSLNNRFQDSTHWFGTVRARPRRTRPRQCNDLRHGRSGLWQDQSQLYDDSAITHEIGTTKVGFAAGFGRNTDLTRAGRSKPKCCTSISEKVQRPLSGCPGEDLEVSLVASRRQTRCGSSAPA